MENFSITFFGVGGSTSAKNKKRERYGANTACVLVQVGERCIILDMGTGLLSIEDVFKEKKLSRADILLSHFHYDHIEGFPFFSPFFCEGKYTIYAEGREGKTPRVLLQGFMKSPYFPITSEAFSAEITSCQIEQRQRLDLGDGIIAATMHTNHPDISTAYRIEYGGKQLVYLLDHEHGNAEIDEEAHDFCKAADILIYDTHFTEEEYSSGKYVGWGHSTHRQGADFARAAGVKKVVFTHHAPWRSDDELDKLEYEMKAYHDGAVMAKEGLVIAL